VQEYLDRGELVPDQVGQQVSGEILAALDELHPFVDRVRERARRASDVTALKEAFGATGPSG
jgi:hypothetical protein